MPDLYSHPTVTENDSEEDDDPEVAAEIQLVAEHSTHFKRVLDGMRIYPKGHKTLMGYNQGLFEKLQNTLAEDELRMMVTPLGFASHGTIVNKADILTDSITHPLYLDGVKHLSILPGLTQDELTRFMLLWRDTLDDNLGDTHTFSTRIWEDDFQCFKVLAYENFGEGAKTSDGLSPRERLQFTMDLLGGVTMGMPNSVRGDFGDEASSVVQIKHMSRISLEDLRQLKARGMPQLSEEDIKKLTQSERVNPPGLSQPETAALSSELQAQHEKVVERVFDAMFLVATESTPQEQDAVVHALGVVLLGMFTKRNIDRVRDNLLRQVEDARTGDPLQMDTRFQTLTRLLKALQRMELLWPLTTALDDESQREAALSVLKFLPTKSETLLLDWISIPESSEGRKAIADLAMTQKVDATEVAGRVSYSDRDMCFEFLRVAQHLGPPGWPIRKAALAHPDIAVQIAALKGIDKATLLANRAELLPLLASPQPQIREILFAPYVASQDKTVAPALCTLLRRQKLDDVEKKKVIIALGSLGGPEAATSLRQLFESESNTELKCNIANSLANIGDEKARPLLEAAAGKLLFGGPVKKAAQDALKRLDALKKEAEKKEAETK